MERKPKFFTREWLIELLSGDMIQETIWERYDEELDDDKEYSQGEKNPVDITVLEPEGCFEILLGDRRFHIIVQELDEEGNEIVQK